MKSLTLFKAAVAASLVSLLAACGGGGGGGASDAPSVAWASPAAFVTPGAASKSFALANCSKYDYVADSNQTLYKATLLIASNGNMSISAATTTTGTVSEMVSIAFADARGSDWSASGTTQTPSYSISMNQQFRSGSKSISAGDYAGDERYLNASLYDSSNTTRVDFYINCDMTDRLALQMSPDQARAAKNLGTAAGVTTFDGYDAEGRIEGGNAFWFNNYASSEYSNLRFNLGTGALASSTSTTGTYSPISLSLPSTNAESGSYGESLNRNSGSFYNYKETKTICLTYNNEMLGKGFEMSATAYGNMFYPRGGRRDMMEPFNTETPQGIRIEGCGGEGRG
jgi:hypothetical protein